MKRIFLTSGLVLCMACPAFAVENDNGVDIASGSTNESCVYNTLEGYNGTSTFTAQWTSVWHKIELDEDDYDVDNNANGIGITTSNIGTDGGALTTANTLYSAQGTSGVYKGYSGTYEGNDMVLTGFTDTSVITTLPNGKSVNYTISTVTPTGATGTPTYPTVNAATRAFDGFWKEVSGTNTRMITDQGALTPSGKAQASDAAANQTWTAQYKCATPTFENVGNTGATTPVWDGYTFKGYGTSDTDPGAGNYVNPGCINENTTLYAFWQAQQFHITYTCGTAQGTSAFTTATTGASANVVSDAINMDGSYTLAANEGSCVLPGYHFKGWNCGDLTAPTSQGGVVESGVYAGGASGKYSYAGNVTCSVVWEANTVYLYSNDGFGGETASAGSCTYDQGITLPTTPNRPGYNFTGWEVANTPAN